MTDEMAGVIRLVVISLIGKNVFFVILLESERERQKKGTSWELV